MSYLSQIQRLAFDKSSARSFNDDGHLRVEISNISKANVCPYYGREIPNHKELGLDENKIYRLFRDPKELEKAASTFNGVPVLVVHEHVTARDHKPDIVVGATGTDAAFDGDHLRNSIFVWEQSAIDGIENGTQKELSCCYHYDPVMKSGEYKGQAYDGIMTNIRANHVALVRKGRAGSSVVVGDSELRRPRIYGLMARKFKMGKFSTSIAFDWEEAKHPREGGKFTNKEKAIDLAKSSGGVAYHSPATSEVEASGKTHQDYHASLSKHGFTPSDQYSTKHAKVSNYKHPKGHLAHIRETHKGGPVNMHAYLTGH